MISLKAETAKFAAAVGDADPARPVLTCPAWTLAQLTAHVGFGHRWAALIVERRATAPGDPRLFAHWPEHSRLEPQ